jgi:hypothetical protein
MSAVERTLRMSRRLVLLAAAVLTSLILVVLCSTGIADPNTRLFLTGGGWTGDPDQKIVFALRLACPPVDDPSQIDGPNQLDVSFGPGSHFHLDTITSASCAVDQDEKQNGGIYRGTGTGVCNGQIAAARFIFRTAGKSGLEEDSAAIEVASDDSSCDVLQAFQLIGAGNLGFHRAGEPTG